MDITSQDWSKKTKDNRYLEWKLDHKYICRREHKISENIMINSIPYIFKDSGQVHKFLGKYKWPKLIEEVDNFNIPIGINEFE